MNTTKAIYTSRRHEPCSQLQALSFDNYWITGCHCFAAAR